MENKNILNLGGKEFEIKVNYRMSYKLTKFRNRLTHGKDILTADKEVIKELQSMAENVNDITPEDVLNLSPAAREYLVGASQKDEELFSEEEQFEIVKILTGIEDEGEIEKLFDAEVIENGYDSLATKLTTAVSMVFMNAKDGLEVTK